ncbi:MAG: hypothetical protein ACOY93_09100 [Bacillota bacterium]
MPRRSYRELPIRPRAGSRQRGPGWGLLGLAAALFALSLGAVVRVSAMPAEARTQEVWYSYQQELHYDFTARVKPGTIYASDLIASGDLVQTRAPVEPPVYRRALVGPLTESVRIRLPYRFVADREAWLQGSYAVGGEIRVPNLWRKEYRFLEPRRFIIRTAELRLDELVVEVPVRQIIDEVRQTSEELRLPIDQIEVRLFPVVLIEVGGQREAVTARLTPELMLLIRNGGAAVEVDEPRTITDAQRFQTEERVALTVSLWRWSWPVAQFRRAAYAALGLVTVALAVLGWRRWAGGRGRPADELRRLGAGLVRAAEFRLPEGVALVEVTRLEQLVQLHLQTERPVVQVGRCFYLLDGSTCYRCAG